MFETSNIANGYSGTVPTGPLSGYLGTTFNTASTVNTPILYSPIITQNMKPQQVKVAVFAIKRDEDTNEINSTSFIKELWVEQKNGTSIDLLVSKQLDKDFDPETIVIKILSTVGF